MIHELSSKSPALKREQLDDPAGGGKIWHTRMLGGVPAYLRKGVADARSVASMPQAFRAEIPADFVIAPHFHAVDQYQVFIGGAGRIGRDQTRPIPIHYADHHTAYGPIVAGPRGITYLTLRAKADPGAVLLSDPDFRTSLKPTQQRHRMMGDLGPMIEPALSAYAAGTVETVLADDDGTGLMSSLLKLGPNMTMRGPDPAGTGGQYYLVINGSMVRPDHELPLWSILFVEPSEPPPDIIAGSEGLEALILQFSPQPSAGAERVA